MASHVVHKAGGGDCFACARRALDEGQRRCQHGLAGQDLGWIQGRQPRSRQDAGHVRLDDLRLHLMTQEPAWHSISSS